MISSRSKQCYFCMVQCEFMLVFWHINVICNGASQSMLKLFCCWVFPLRGSFCIFFFIVSYSISSQSLGDGLSVQRPLKLLQHIKNILSVLSWMEDNWDCVEGERKLTTLLGHFQIQSSFQFSPSSSLSLNEAENNVGENICLSPLWYF